MRNNAVLTELLRIFTQVYFKKIFCQAKSPKQITPWKLKEIEAIG